MAKISDFLSGPKGNCGRGSWAGVAGWGGRAPSGVLCLLQTHQTIVVQLLQSTTRLLECPWLQQQHKGSVEACVRTLAMVGE